MKKIPVRSIHNQELQAEALKHFKIRSVKDVLTGTDMNQDLHRHDFYFILFVTKGKGVHTVDFIEYKVSNHSIFIMRPGQVHELRLIAGSEGYLLEFNKDFQLLSLATGNTLLRKAAGNNFYKLDKSGSTLINEILQTMLQEYRSKQDGFETIIQASLVVFLVQVLRQQGQLKAANSNPYQQEKLQEFLDLLETNINTTKQVTAYADMMSLSPFQLNSITKSLLGKTVAELIDEQIVLEAKRNLLATSNQVNQIAFELGYEDVSYFIRFFKKSTGHTPESFRKNFR